MNRVEYWIYSIKDCAGKLLYIGSTTNKSRRFQDHLNSNSSSRLAAWIEENGYKPFIEAIGLCETREEMIEIEAQIIRNLQPPLNISHSNNKRLVKGRSAVSDEYRKSFGRAWLAYVGKLTHSTNLSKPYRLSKWLTDYQERH